MTLPLEMGEKQLFQETITGSIMNKKKGFSIVEVLVALGIIGIVTAISVPNYTRMKRASKKAEAHSSLGQIYIAEKAFYLQWRYYTVDLVLMGAIPEGPLTYNVGFHGDGVITCDKATQNCSPANYRGPFVNKENKNFAKICGQNFEGTDDTQKQCAFQYKAKSCGAGTSTSTNNQYKIKYCGFEPPAIPDKTTGNKPYTATADEFLAGAVANLIDKKNQSHQGTKNDAWSINQFKQVRRECGDKCPY